MVEKNKDKKNALKRPKKKKKPTFNVLNYGFFKAVKDRWRKPRGTANKKRRKKKWAGALPKIGYKNPASVAGLREDGRKEILIRGLPDLEIIKNSTPEERSRICLKFSSSLSKRTRAKMAEMIKEYGIEIVNFKKDDSKGG
ncbi:MAG: eL32 family ribosomal protein [Candidatus Bilamarchaeaceae archaeon]